MAQSVAAKQALKSIFWYRGQYSLFYYIGLTFLGALVLAASAQIQLPLKPVPVTLQSFAVVLLAMSMGWRLGLASCLSYLGLGMMGLPVFAGFFAGSAYLLGPTGGYLVAFPLAVLASGWLAQKGAGKHLFSSFLVAALGLAIILVVGTLYLSTFVGVQHALQLGVQPFILDAILKAVMIAVIVPRVWRFEK